MTPQWCQGVGAAATAGPVGSVGRLVPGGGAAGAGPGVAGALSGLIQVGALGGGGSGPVGVSFGLTGLEPFGLLVLWVAWCGC